MQHNSDGLDANPNLELCFPCYFVGPVASDSPDDKGDASLEWKICNNARREWREYGRHERPSFDCPYFVDKFIQTIKTASEVENAT